MPNLTVVIPDSLASILNSTIAQRATSRDSVVTAALSQYFKTGRHRAYQISTSAALVQGVSEGAMSSRKLLANDDFGLGTFEHLNGEMVVLDGIIYQVRGDGTVEPRRDDFQIPFAVVSRFQPDENFEIGGISSLNDLHYSL
jgi:acetolactate decarboxylase